MKARGCDHKHPQFVHTLYNDNKVESDLFENVVGIIVKNFFEKYNISEKTIIRAKVNMTTKSSSNKKTTPHIDYPYNHYVMIYYVDDSDGDTVIYKQKYGQKRLWLSEYKRIKPKAGRCVIFDGLHYHSPSLPKNHQSRCVLNINFID